MNLSVTIDVNELVYDIQNKTYLTGRSRSDGKNYRQVALMQANNDDENFNQIMRSISNAFARVKNELAEVLQMVTESVTNKLDDDTADRCLVLVMPSNFNPKAADAISAAIHQYIVNASTADWFLITNKADSEGYSRQAQECLELLRESLCKRSRPVRNVADKPVS